MAEPLSSSVEPAPEETRLDPDATEEELGASLSEVIPSRAYRALPVVGLGGSAGCIPALKTFLANVPARSGLAYVVVLHLAPDYESALAAVLQHATHLPVSVVEGGERVVADHVYVIPPGTQLTFVDDRLRLTELRREPGGRKTVDVFFRSLADARGPHAVAIVLSGADGDGAVGIARVKERGGLTIAQDPSEAEHPSMPRTALATGMIDWAIDVASMPARLLEYRAREARLGLSSQNAEPGAEPGDTLDALLELLHDHTGHDFTPYERVTLLRRVERRMQVNQLDELPHYLARVRSHPGELGALLDDLLISGSNFFRDAAAFRALNTQLPALFAGKGQNDSLRVWVPGCATGEEAYSLAILLLEHARSLEGPPLLQVFATDINAEAVGRARRGIYPGAISADVSPERLREFFSHENGFYRVRRSLRELVLFATHDVLRDAPFSRLSLVSCRNVLTYLRSSARAQALDVFHYALRPGGRLFLGSAESVADYPSLFDVVDAKHRLFAARAAVRGGLPTLVSPRSGRVAEARRAQLAQGGDSTANPARPEAELALADAQRELRETQDRHGVFVQELEISNEELQAMNEELKASREELESINEELKTKVDELGRANNDLQNLIGATAIATIFLDPHLRIMRFTPSAVLLFHLLPSDVGRPLADLRHGLQYPELLVDASRVVSHLTLIEREVREQSGRSFLARLLPYRTTEDRVVGVVLTFIDVTERQLAQEALSRAHRELERRVRERTAELDAANAALQAEAHEHRLAQKARQELQRRMVNIQEEERRRISRELHDEVGQQLTALMLSLKALESAPPGHAAAEELRALRATAEQAAHEIHQLAAELRPISLDDLGLTRALTSYVETWSSRTGIPVDFLSSGFERRRLPSATETTLYRIVQEAMNNIWKHASAKTASVSIEWRNEVVLCTVEDDGVGFDLTRHQAGTHIGIAGMRERAELIGGELTVESKLGRGTVVRAEIRIAQLL